MKECIVFLDESGDLGWKFHQPYRAGGSSRYLTISATIVPLNKSHLLSRAIRDLYNQYNWEVKKEKKWARMKPIEKHYFAKSLSQLALDHEDIRFLSITVYKPRVRDHIRKDPNKLYNYMIGLMLLEEIKFWDKVIFTPDPRSIKVECGHSLYDYLVTKLWLELGVKTEVINKPQDSAANKGVQFTDMFSGLIQQCYEDGAMDLIKSLPGHRIGVQTLFFRNGSIDITRTEETSKGEKLQVIVT